jgi:hypothetical protein
MDREIRCATGFLDHSRPALARGVVAGGSSSGPTDAAGRLAGGVSEILRMLDDYDRMMG